MGLPLLADELGGHNEQQSLFDETSHVRNHTSDDVLGVHRDHDHRTVGGHTEEPGFVHHMMAAKAHEPSMRGCARNAAMDSSEGVAAPVTWLIN